MPTISTTQAAERLSAIYGYPVTAARVRVRYRAGKLAGVVTPSGRVRIYQSAIKSIAARIEAEK